jgi:hypothetical protein
VAIVTIKAHPQRVTLRSSWVGAGLVLLFVAWTGDRAEASCGDWLADHYAPPGQTEQLDDRPLLPATCHGPNCRQSREQLPVIPPAPNRQFDRPERWCRLIEEPTALPTLSFLLPPEADLFLVSAFSVRIERPPRV